MYNYEPVIEACKNRNIKFFVNEPMSKYTTFKIGGPADLFIEVDYINDLKDILTAVNTSGIPMITLGKGSNLLVSDLGIRGVVLRLGKEFSKVEIIDDFKIKCGSAVALAKLCVSALENSLSGLEFAYGIPGCVGGATFMNAGAYGGEMKDVLLSSTHITRDSKIQTLNIDEMELSYRSSIYNKNNSIITSVVVKLHKDDYNTIRSKMDDFMLRRKTKQPLEYPSAGSVFKRPKGYYAGTLIEECGLKGRSVGDAMVSDKHAGFIINKGNATCSDVLNLIQVIKDEVKKKSGVTLECEIRPIGEFK